MCACYIHVIGGMRVKYQNTPIIRTIRRFYIWFFYRKISLNDLIKIQNRAFFRLIYAKFIPIKKEINLSLFTIHFLSLSFGVNLFVSKPPASPPTCKLSQHATTNRIATVSSIQNE